MNDINNKRARMHRYYKLTNFYSFLKGTAIKGAIIGIIIILAVFLVDKYIIDTREILSALVHNYSKKTIISSFFLSEVFLGILAPEIYIAWCSQLASPWFYLFLIATASYVGGIVAYFIGMQLYRISTVREYVEIKIAKHITNLRKWGGVLVFIGAMFPIPHSIVSMACGLIRYNFKHYLLWALFRYLRFAIYGYIIFQIY